MKLTVLGSGSRGNAFALTDAGVTLLLDAGFGPKILRQRAERSGVALDRVIGIVVTHEHGDHARGAARLARRLRCPLYASRGTLSAMAPRLADADRRTLACHVETPIGPFTLTACPVPHDAMEPLALRVVGADGETSICLVYDLGRPTSATRYLMRDATCLLLEANHDELMLRTGPYPPVIRDRIGGTRGHLSNRAAAQLLAESVHPGLRAVVLVHLSERCNTEELVKREMQGALEGTGFRGRMLIARQNDPLPPIVLAGGTRQLELGLAG